MYLTLNNRHLAAATKHLAVFFMSKTQMSIRVATYVATGLVELAIGTPNKTTLVLH